MKKKLLSLLLVPTMLAATLTVCASAEKSSGTAAVFNAETKPATQSTIEVNRQVYDFLNFEDTSEFEKCGTRFHRRTGHTESPWRERENRVDAGCICVS